MYTWFFFFFFFFFFYIENLVIIVLAFLEFCDYRYRDKKRYLVNNKGDCWNFLIMRCTQKYYEWSCFYQDKWTRNETLIFFKIVPLSFSILIPLILKLLFKCSVKLHHHISSYSQILPLRWIFSLVSHTKLRVLYLLKTAVQKSIKTGFITFFKLTFI